MKRFIFCWLGLTIIAGCTEQKNYVPDHYLTVSQKQAILTSVVRYAGRKPENAGDEKKFDVKYDSFYRAQASRMHLDRYFVKGDDYYFLISQPAPSLVEKRHATGGRFRLNDRGEMIHYEEIFRTWKMIPDTLRSRSYVLFDRMVTGSSLEPFLTQNSKGVEYIEFPDDRTFYDTAGRLWKMR